MTHKITLRKIDLFLVPVLTYLITGFDISWLLMKIPYVDMRFNTGRFILIGLILGFFSGLLNMVKVKPKNNNLFFFSQIFLASLLSLPVALDIIWDTRASTVVIPILIKEGLGLRTWSNQVILTLAFLIFGLIIWRTWYALVVKRRDLT
jgi:hypothetical protein